SFWPSGDRASEHPKFCTVSMRRKGKGLSISSRNSGFSFGYSKRCFRAPRSLTMTQLPELCGTSMVVDQPTVLLLAENAKVPKNANASAISWVGLSVERSHTRNFPSRFEPETKVLAS